MQRAKSPLKYDNVNLLSCGQSLQIKLNYSADEAFEDLNFTQYNWKKASTNLEKIIKIATKIK